jgi:hypothetical protein
LSEKEGPAVDGDQRLAGGQRTRSGSGLPQGHHRQQAYDAGEMVAASRTRETTKPIAIPLVLPQDHCVQDDGGADAG